MLSKLLNACFSDFYHAYYYSILPISAIISLFHYKKVEKPFQLLCVLIIITCISEFLALYLRLSYNANGIEYNIFTPVEYFIYTKIYSIFFNNRIWNAGLMLSVLCLIFLEILNIILLQKTTDFPTNIISIESVFLVYLSTKLFLSIRDKPVYENLLKEGVFWFNSAVLFYYSFDILTAGFYEIMPSLKEPEKINGNMLLLFSGLLYITLVVSVLLNNNFLNNPKQKNAPAFTGSR